VRRTAHLFALSGFALAQPLYDLLGRNPEFFAAHGATRLEIVVFALALALIPPAVLAAAGLAASLIDARLGCALHLAFVATLSGLVALQGLGRLDAPAAVVLALAAAAGIAAAAAYAVFTHARACLTVLAAAPVVFLGLFLLGSEAADLLRESEARAEVARIAPSRTTVVLLVLDELPLNSLLDGRRRIDPVRYPHLAALARRADWFPNATTVHEGTVGAIPAILTGRLPHPGELPRFDDHPNNLFTLLGGRYRLEAFDVSTSLCPASLCRDSARSFAGGLRALVEDSSVVYLHVVLPERLARTLPPVTERWAGFLGESTDEAAHFGRFVNALERIRRPTLAYGHFLLPHSPWQHVPSGERYELRPPAELWGRDEVWTEDESLVVESWQRHLMQTAYVDALLGRLLSRLETTGLYDRSLLIVVADHGISFRPGRKRRPVSSSNLEDIAFVPLLVKRPGQQRGRVLERHVRTVDIVPTIAALLGVRVPWAVEGRSMYRASRGPSRVVVGKDGGGRIALPLPEAIRRRRAALARQLALFGSGPASALYGVGRYRELLGRPPPSAARAGGRVELDYVQRLGGGLVAVAGTVAVGVGNVVLVDDGRLAAVAPVFRGRFWALVPSAAGLEPRVLSIEGAPNAPRYRTLRR
jgi:sulfatase-like protein